jgi:UDP-N-acetylglucosamine 2-epimerase (non-hydrolysing)
VKNITVAFGTRPEAIKLAPVIAELRRRASTSVRIVSTAQHREMLAQVLRVFGITPDVDLDLMQPGQTLAELGGRVLTSMDRLLAGDRQDVLVVQGDTSSAFMCALAAFYRGVAVAHVEAGLRTNCPTNPFPEEMNRRLISAVASRHFAPTERARRALLAEGIPSAHVLVTGNTVVDALLQIRASAAYRAIRLPLAIDRDQRRLLLVTLHRRESWGEPLAGMCRALRAIVDRRNDVRIVFPVHLNPTVRDTVHAILGGHTRVTLIEPVDYLEFVALLDASLFVLTDSGGVQEEAPALGRPVLVLRDTTERPEVIEHGTGRLVGTSPAAIEAAALALLDNDEERARMARVVSPFGDGHAAARIADVLEAWQPAESMVRV